MSFSFYKHLLINVFISSIITFSKNHGLSFTIVKGFTPESSLTIRDDAMAEGLDHCTFVINP